MPEPLSRCVFLVSGGARGVTAECVIALARAHGGSFVLLGRTSLDPHPGLDERAPDDGLRRQIASLLSGRGERSTPAAVERIFKGVRARQEISRTLERIERAGGRARYIAADVTDGEALRRAIAEARVGPIHGIIHGAGTLADRRIESKTDQDIESVYATKIHGLRAMLSCVDESRLSYLALFSSTSGFHGNVGQSDYAAANEVLNKFAHAFKLRFPGCRTVVFDWGPWDGGMVTPFLRSIFESSGVKVMPVETGARAFVDVLGDERAGVQVLVNDIGQPHPRSDDAVPARGPRGGLTRVSRAIDLAQHRFLLDHQIAGHPVLPAACAGGWMAGVCQQAAPGYRFASLVDFRVLKGLVFDGTQAARYLLESKEEEASTGAIARSVLISSEAPGQRARLHYRGKVLLARTPPEAPARRRFDLSADPRFERYRPYAEGALFHGPAFQVIERVLSVEPGRIAIRCRLPRPVPGLFGSFAPVAFDAVVLDAQFQCLGLWVHLSLGAVALPTSWGRLDVFGPPPVQSEFYISAEIEEKSDFAVRAAIFVHDASGQIFAQLQGAELTLHRPAVLAPAAAPEAAIVAAPAAPVARAEAATEAGLVVDERGIRRALRDVERPVFIARAGARLGILRERKRVEAARGRGALVAELLPTPPSSFGAASFRREYGVSCAYMAGAMAKGIATEELVIALGRAGYLGCFGAGGLPIPRLEQAVVRILEALPAQPYAFNLLHSPRKLAIEDATVDVYLRHGVRTVEASSYVDLTPSIVRYRAAGLAQRPDGSVVAKNRIIVKLSRLELARLFMQPPPEKVLRGLVEAGRISREQAELASRVSMADDVTFEADSGGHTDNRPLVALLPAALALRDEIQRERRYPVAIRVGAAGGIATPQAVLAAFAMGADYVVTGSINQACVEAGTSEHVKRLLASVEMTDVTMAPESDLFELGGRVQVVKLRSLFPMRAHKLYSCYQSYESLEAIPGPVRRQLEQQIFKSSLDEVWALTARYLAAHRPEQLERASDPKVKMALLFKWYLGQSSRWAVDGVAGRELDYQVWCGPAMGAFNAWARGTYLESPENRRVADVARVLMSEAAYLYRLQQLRLGGMAEDLLAEGMT